MVCVMEMLERFGKNMETKAKIGYRCKCKYCNRYFNTDLNEQITKFNGDENEFLQNERKENKKDFKNI